MEGLSEINVVLQELLADMSIQIPSLQDNGRL